MKRPPPKPGDTIFGVCSEENFEVSYCIDILVAKLVSDLNGPGVLISTCKDYNGWHEWAWTSHDTPPIDEKSYNQASFLGFEQYMWFQTLNQAKGYLRDTVEAVLKQACKECRTVLSSSIATLSKST